jgi:protein-tyrosine phosphatase
LYHIHSFSGSAQLFVSPYPKEEGVFELWKQSEITLVVSLLTGEEQVHLNLVEEERQLGKRGIHFISFEIEDFGVPASAQAFNQLLNLVDHHVRSGKSLLVHCRAGQGRSGLLSIAIMMHKGMSLEEAFAVFTKARGCNWPEAQIQKSFLENWSEMNSESEKS